MCVWVATFAGVGGLAAVSGLVLNFSCILRKNRGSFTTAGCCTTSVLFLAKSCLSIWMVSWAYLACICAAAPPPLGLTWTRMTPDLSGERYIIARLLSRGFWAVQPVG